VRAYAEHLGLPVQQARDDTPPFWRLRETQAVLDWLRACDGAALPVQALADWLAQPSHTGPWWEVLRDAFEAYQLETAGAELPVAHWTEWLADWGRELRRRQSGLLLCTAHSAKGLEFDHLVVLDGGWTPGHGVSDSDEVLRRLAYVAVTRARETLALTRLVGTTRSVFDGVWDGADAPPPEQPAEWPSTLARQYRMLSPAEVDLGYAGRLAPEHPAHAALARLTPGEGLTLRLQGERREFVDEAGTVVGRLSRGCVLDPALRCVGVRVSAVLVRRRDDVPLHYQDVLRSERWEWVLPELVLEPLPGDAAAP
jgi:ATP-dependent DNA helicase RecQ